MPADQSEERKSAMAAFGAELISVPSSSNGGGMEAARDLAARMQVIYSCIAACTQLFPIRLASMHVHVVDMNVCSCMHRQHAAFEPAT